MINLKYSLVIEATDDPTFFGFYSPDLEGFTGIGHSIEDCLYQARWGMEEHLGLLRDKGMPIPTTSSNPTVVIQNERRVGQAVLCLSACFSRPQELAITGVLNLRVGRRTSVTAKAEQGLKSGPRFTTTVRAEDEFIEIDLELAAADAVVGADQPALKVPDHPVGKRNDGLGSLAQLKRGRLRSWHMGIAARREHPEAREAIGGDGGTCGDVSGSELLDGGSCEIGYDLHPDSTGRPSPPFDCNQNQRGVAPSELATAPQSCLSSPHPGLVHLNLAAKRVPRRVHHRATELVQHHPRGLVAAESQLLLQEEGRQPTLIRRHQIRSPKPRHERGLRIVEDCPGRHRDLIAAGGTLPAPAACQAVRGRLTAPRTPEPIWPAACRQILRASVLAGKLLLELPQALGETRSRHPTILPIAVC